MRLTRAFTGVSLTTKIVLPTAIALVVVTGTIVTQGFFAQEQSIIEAEDARLTAAYEGFTSYLDQRGSPHPVTNGEGAIKIPQQCLHGVSRLGDLAAVLVF